MSNELFESLIAKKPDYIICTCFEVTHHQIVKAILDGENSLPKLVEKFGVTTGCSSCLPDIEELLKIYAPKKA